MPTGRLDRARFCGGHAVREALVSLQGFLFFGGLVQYQAYL